MSESLKGGKALNVNFNSDGNFNVNSNWNSQDRNPKMGGRSFLVGSCFAAILGISSSLQAFCQFPVRMLGVGDFFYFPGRQYPWLSAGVILRDLSRLWIFLLGVVFYLVHSSLLGW